MLNSFCNICFLRLQKNLQVRWQCSFIFFPATGQRLHFQPCKIKHTPALWLKSNQAPLSALFSSRRVADRGWWGWRGGGDGTKPTPQPHHPTYTPSPPHHTHWTIHTSPESTHPPTSLYPPPLVSVATAKPEVTVKLVCRWALGRICDREITSAYAD